MCTGRVTMSLTSSLVNDTFYLVSIVSSLAIRCCLTGFSITKSVFLKKVRLCMKFRMHYKKKIKSDKIWAHSTGPSDPVGPTDKNNIWYSW
ncbi:hypothetical protein LINPERHAP2_LOCUS7795 [Linum perenne]